MLVDRLGELGARRVAVVFDREIYGRELAGQVTTLARDAGITPVAAEEYRGRVDDIPDIVRRLGEAEPDAVVHLCVAGRGTIPMLVSIGARLPGVPVLASSGILALPELALPPEPERLEAVGPALEPGARGPPGDAPRAGRHRARGPRPPPRDRGRPRARQSSCNCSRGHLPARPGRAFDARPGEIFLALSRGVASKAAQSVVRMRRRLEPLP